jgi:hypothetical protein
MNTSIFNSEAAKIKATEALESMGLSDMAYVWLDGEIETLAPAELFATLEARAGETIVISGDWTKSDIDCYDLAKKFVEDNYLRARAKKADAGWYVIVANGKINATT